MYEVILAREAEKYYSKYPPKVQQRIDKIIGLLEENPLSYRAHIKKLHGPLAGKYRFEEGPYRIVYTIDKEQRRVSIITIRTRGDVYKRLKLGGKADGDKCTGYRIHY